MSVQAIMSPYHLFPLSSPIFLSEFPKFPPPPVPRAHVAYIVIVVGRTHMQIGHVYRKKQHGPSFSNRAHGFVWAH